jgi:two-component system sensor histidine kinase YesM
MRLSAIEQLFTESPIGKGGFLYIADSGGEMVYAPVNKVVYRLPIEALSRESSSVIVRVSSTDYQVLAQLSPYTGWRTIGVFSLAETLREVLLIRYWTYFIGGITMILAILVGFFFTSSIAKPVLDLRSLMKRVEDGDLSVRFSGLPSDEIGELGLGFNEMIERIQSLINQVYVEQRSKREAEIRILQEQIKPHFLYNTLDTIQWMAQEHRVDDVVSMVGALSSLFRIGLNKGREFISLSDELEHVESYLCIQKMRYEDKFDYSIRCDPGLRSRQVMRLTLQPLVENAIYHGIKERRGHGTLLVEARADGGDLLLVVSDDGVGMTAETLAQLTESLEEGGSPIGGYGIHNVHERIRLTFGKPYGLSFKSAYGEGTVVTVRHPDPDAED